jgi:archaellum biogenesis protein FlaJ (TadC family)
MAQKQLSEYTLEELQSRIKVTKYITIMLAVVLVATFLFSLYITVKKEEFNPGLIIPLTMVPIAVINMVNMKKMQDEINRREEQS